MAQKITLYGLKNCDTCRKAVKDLTAAGHDAVLVDLRACPLTDDQVTRFLDAFGQALVNTRSTTWRGLDDAEKAKPPYDLLKTHPALMKRPVIDTGQTLFLGWGQDVKGAFF